MTYNLERREYFFFLYLLSFAVTADRSCCVCAQAICRLYTCMHMQTFFFSYQIFRWNRPKPDLQIKELTRYRLLAYCPLPVVVRAKSRNPFGARDHDFVRLQSRVKLSLIGKPQGKEKTQAKTTQSL